jgi:hypothetical protein
MKEAYVCCADVTFQGLNYFLPDHVRQEEDVCRNEKGV